MTLCAALGYHVATTGGGCACGAVSVVWARPMTVTTILSGFAYRPATAPRLRAVE